MLKPKYLSILGGAAALAVFAMAQDASAAPLTLNGPISGNTLGPQSTSNPCIIAATQCQQPAGFGFNNFTASGAISSYNMFSTTPTANVADGVQGTPYTVSQLPTSFDIAIDVNTTSAAGENLTLFEVLDITTSTTLYSFTAPAGPTFHNIGTVFNNGNGFADYTLSRVDLSGHPGTDQILFHAVWQNATDGGESFFIANAIPAPVIGHGLLVLLAVGGVLVGSKFLERRRTPIAA